mmetsp:Transcript_29333/g.46832  ORF Transcript_29333/g.46832 Transcript_29333/m.46832 type:complete len:145 (+) Transcript_29333:1859-2293(+)
MGGVRMMVFSNAEVFDATLLATRNDSFTAFTVSRCTVHTAVYCPCCIDTACGVGTLLNRRTEQARTDIEGLGDRDLNIEGLGDRDLETATRTLTGEQDRRKGETTERDLCTVRCGLLAIGDAPRDRHTTTGETVRRKATVEYFS